MKGGFLERVRGRFQQGLLVQEALDRSAGVGLVINPYRVYVKHLGARDRTESADLEGFRFRELTCDDVPAMSDILLREVPIDHLRQRFEGGGTCYGIFDRDSLVAFTCVSRDFCLGAKGSVLFELGPDEAYGHSNFVSRPYRRSGVHELLMQRCFDELRDIGVESHYAFVSYFNRVARKAVEKLGYAEIDQRFLLRFFGLVEFNPRIGFGRRTRGVDVKGANLGSDE